MRNPTRQKVAPRSLGPLRSRKTLLPLPLARVASLLGCASIWHFEQSVVVHVEVLGFMFLSSLHVIVLCVLEEPDIGGVRRQ